MDGITGAVQCSSGVITGNLTVQGEIINAQLDDIPQALEIGTVTSVPNSVPSSASLYPVGDGLYKLDLSLQAGVQGIQGVQGPVGNTGDTGPPPTILSEVPTTIVPTGNATAVLTEISDNVYQLSLGIPQGPPGVNGQVIFSETVPVATLSAESTASAFLTNVNGSGVYQLSLSIPRGNTGAQGPQGPKGDDGPKGDKGDKGDTGDTGPAGDSTAATAAAAVASAAAVTAAGSAAAASTSATAAAASAATAATSAAAAEQSAATVAQRTVYMNSGSLPQPYTSFDSDLNVKYGVATVFSVDSWNQGNVKTNGKIECAKSVYVGENAYVDGNIEATQVQANTVKGATISSSNFTKNAENAAAEITFNAPIKINAPQDPTNPFASITGLFVDEIKSADAELSSVKIHGVVCGPDSMQVEQVQATSLSVSNGNISFQNTDLYNPTTFSVDRNVGTTQIFSPNIQLGPAQVGTGSSQVNLNGNITVSSNVNTNAMNASTVNASSINGTNINGSVGIFSQGIYAPNLFVSQAGGGFIQFA